MSAKRCIYPGSFDPVTCGHMDIIRRAAGMFDEVIVGVLHNPDKRGCFSVEERVDMLRRACAGLPNVQVIAHGGLLAELTRSMEIPVVVRGVRGAADLEMEATMARINHQLNPAQETIFLPAAPELTDVSASMVRQLAAFGADISPFVPKEVLSEVTVAFSSQTHA